MVSKEIFLIFLFGLIAEILFLFLFKSQLFVPLVFGIFFMIFFAEKVLLRDSLKFSQLTLPSFFLLFYFAVMVLPSVFRFSQVEPVARHTYLIAIQSVPAAFLFGILLVNFFFRKPADAIKKFLQTKLEKTANDKKFIPLLMLLFLSSAPIVALYSLSVEQVQLFELFKPPAEKIDVEAFRFAEKTAPDAIHGLFELLRRFFLPFSLLFAYFISILYKKGWKLFFWIIFVVTFFVSALTLDRAEPVVLIIAMIMAYLLGKNQSLFKVLKPKLLAAVLLAIIIGAAISVFQYRREFTLQRFTGSVWGVFVNRVILDPSFMASWAFQDFPDSSSLLYGKSIKLVAMTTGQEHLAAYPATFVGDLWRNFGWSGVIGGTVFFGFVFQLIQLKLFQRKNIFTLSVYVILLVNAIWLIFGNAFGTMSVAVFLSSVFFLLFGRLISGSRPYPVTRPAKDQKINSSSIL